MKVRTVKEQDYQEIADLEVTVWGEEGASYDIIRSRHEIFPEGSFVVEEEDGTIVGYAAVQRVNRASDDTWFEQTDSGYIKESHVPDGHILYGIGMAGLKHGVADLIIKYAHDYFIASGICYMLVLGSRVPGFAAWTRKTGLGIKEYITTRRPDGYSIDPELMLYQKHGFEILCEMHHYFPCEDSLDYGALIIKK
ncbi:hypothetical protein [Vibrio sp. SCSIO 43137]|uniref:hypothetical protein n=1 Tax=Vibrio sp. SCSIO 43137 TaxID=3021011 RepID=UPI002307DEA8|nr:hypothetical protein [Vibrio sp. SCSIO 43137]WCE32038.1 hypothetical protein PK654_16150 [Vibrio sp. SCSIO 43137]